MPGEHRSSASLWSGFAGLCFLFRQIKPRTSAICRATLFHVEPAWIRATRFADIRPDDHQIALMERYREWLVTEGVRAGGIGPAEPDRIDRRHLGDSVLFASQLRDVTGTVWDLGSGVGLPGIPLAICLPDLEFVLIDRSGRRVDLMRRVMRVLDLANCQVVHSEITDLDGEPDALVSRASLPPDQLSLVAERLLAPGGLAIVAGSWHQAPLYPGWTTVEIPAHVLDQTVWLLIMRRE